MAAIVKKLMGKSEKSKSGKVLEDVGIANLRNQDVQRRIDEYKDAQEKIKSYTLFDETIMSDADKYINKIAEGIFEINQLINKIGAPWGGAGSEEWFADCRSAWKTMYAQFMSGASSVKLLLNYRNKVAPAQPKLATKPSTPPPSTDPKQRVIDNLKRSTLPSLLSPEETQMSSVIDTDNYALDDIFDDVTDPNSSKLELVNNFFTYYQVEYLAYAQLMLDLCWRRDDVATNWALTIYQPPIPTAMHGQSLQNMADPNIKDRDVY